MPSGDEADDEEDEGDDEERGEARRSEATIGALGACCDGDDNEDGSLAEPPRSMFLHATRMSTASNVGTAQPPYLDSQNQV